MIGPEELPNMQSSRNPYCGESDKGLHQRRFLEAFGVSCSVQKAAKWAGIHRQTHYDWLASDPSYPARFKAARVRAGQALEDEAVRRAYEGIRKPVLYKGKPVYFQGAPLYEAQYSDRLLERLLEANNPSRFKQHVENTNLLEIDPKTLTDEQLDVLADHFLKRVTGNDPVAIAEIERQIAAGEPVVIDGVSEVID